MILDRNHSSYKNLHRRLFLSSGSVQLSLQENNIQTYAEQINLLLNEIQ